MGIISGIATLMLPLITITISFCTAFVITIWFSLSVIYGIIEIINLLLGQPFVGWLMTGDITATNDIRNLFDKNMFSFTSPMMIFLYAGLAISLFMFVIYFVWNIFDIKSLGNFRFSTSGIGLCLILLSVAWIPFLYSLLVLVSAGLMTGINSLLKIKENTHLNTNLKSLKYQTISNLTRFKDFLKDLDFKYVDKESEQVLNFLNKLPSDDKSIFVKFIDIWNENQISENTINIWIDTLNNIDLDHLDKLTNEQRNIILDIATWSSNLEILYIYEKQILNNFSSSESLKMFNEIFISSDYLNLENFRLSNIFILYQIDEEWTIEKVCFYIVNNQIVFSNKFSQNLVNILYSLALGKNSVFVPGWSSNIVGQSWNLFWMIPKEMKIIGVNISIYLFYNLKVIIMGSIINSILLTSIVVFALILIRRFVYIAFWPIYMLYLLARSGGTGDSSFAKFGINELFFKFINILIFGLLWNFICFLTTSIFTILDQTNPSELFGSQTWIMDIFKLFAVIGIIISGFAIIGDILQKLSEEKSNASSGASEVAKASSKASSETSKMKNKASRSMSKSTKSFNKNIGQRWNGAGRSAWTETKGQGFKARTGATAKAMFNYKGGGK